MRESVHVCVGRWVCVSLSAWVCGLSVRVARAVGRLEQCLSGLFGVVVVCACV